MNALLAIIRRLIVQTEAATLTEYGLMLLLIALFCVAVIAYIGSQLVLPMYRIPEL